jgi:hypothetical protein
MPDDDVFPLPHGETDEPAAPSTGPGRRPKIGERVRIDAYFTDVGEGVVSHLDELGFQIEGRNLWFGWHEFVGILAP